MSARAIEKLRRKFIIVATLSFVGAMLLIASLIYLTNLVVTRREIRNVINYIVENEGDLPAPSGGEGGSSARKRGSGAQVSPGETEAATGTGLPSAQADLEKGQQALQNESDSASTDLQADGVSENEMMEISLADLFGYRNRLYASPEFYYSIRYFAVLFDEQCEVTQIKTSHIAAVDDEEAEAYGRVALNQFFKFGSFGVFYYKVASLKDGGRIVVYLDSTNQVTTNSRLLVVALALIGLGMIIAFLLVRILSFRVVRPEIENSERQKQFITNASHELKTPLAVIRANTEVEQMINGENEWNTSTMNQVDRLNGLIANLVMIAKAEERENDTPRARMDISVPVSETVDTFLPVASADGKTLLKEISNGVMLVADESEIRQLVSLLTDNAIKYCDAEGTIRVSLSQGRGRSARLLVSNSYAEGEDVDYARFFDRFYRKDESHNVDKGGYGIGLSIAESLVEQYKGSLDVNWKDGEITFTCMLANVPAK